MSSDASRKSIWFPPELWAEVEAAAAREGAAEGKPVTVSEFIRRACRERIQKMGPTP